MINRRQFLRRGALTGGAAALASLGIDPRRAFADVSPGDLRFLFVFAPGGWDPLTVFAPMFGSGSVDMEAEAQTGTAGGIPFVDHEGRPSVRAFFEAWHESTLLLNGISVRSLSHEISTSMVISGSSGTDAPDWATRLASAQQAEFTLPHLVLGGPAQAGDLGTAVARTGAMGQLDGLLSGEILENGDRYDGRPSLPAEHVIDAYMARRAAGRVLGARDALETARTADFQASLERTRALKDRRQDMEFVPGFDLLSQADAALEALSLGIARCASVAHPATWDTHANNAQQSDLFEDLFGTLAQVMERMAARPGSTGGSQLDETVMVVLSEMGRTPKLNGALGRDHWPYTSAMLVGPGLSGDRVVGGWDERYYGLGVDRASGEISESADLLGTDSLGATILALAGLDPASDLPGAEAIAGVLA